MTTDPHEPISDFTEMTDSGFGALRAFAKAWAWGTIVSAGVFLVITVPLGIAFMFDDLFLGLYLLVLPLLVAGTIVLVALLTIGLPLTGILVHLKAERIATYENAGGFAGFCIPLATLLFFEGGIGVALIFALFGTVGGVTAAHHWGRWRVHGVRPPSTASEPDHPTNPYHDMIY